MSHGFGSGDAVVVVCSSWGRITSVGDTDEEPVDVRVGLSCNPPNPHTDGSGHRRQAAALPPSEEERFSPGSELPLVLLAEGYPRDDPRRFLGGEHKREKRKKIDAGRKLGVPYHRNVAGGKRKGGKVSPCLNLRESL